MGTVLTDSLGHTLYYLSPALGYCPTRHSHAELPGGCFKKNVGEGGAKIDGIPWGGHPGNGYQPGDGTWGTVNNNFRARVPWGN